jgi:hypothetical protein
MSRPKLPTSRLFPIATVIGTVSIDPIAVDAVKHLIHPTGKRGRPSTKVDGHAVVATLKRHKATAALKFFREMAAAQA